jgi:hypothetical protein
MEKTKILVLIAIAATLSSCGSNFEWFPKTSDTTAPIVSASIAGNTIFNNRTTHVTSLPAIVTFSANEAATIYYTTNGDAPTTSSNSVSVTSSAGATGPAISLTNTILKFFGIDKSSNSSAIQTGTIKSP